MSDVQGNNRLQGGMRMMGGSLVFAIITFRAKVFPLWVPVLLVLMILNLFIPVADNKFFAAFWGLAYVGMGTASGLRN